jgi:hypothetical protein
MLITGTPGSRSTSTLTAFERFPRGNQRQVPMRWRSAFQVLMVGLIMAGLFTGKRTGRSASWEHVRIGSSIL